MRLVLDPAGLTPPLRRIVDTLAGDYPLVSGPGAACRAGDLAVTLVPGAPAGTLDLARRGRQVRLAYDQPAQACRGLGALLAGLVAPGARLRERTPLTTFGIMLDCSRNAVMKPEHVRLWLRRLALLGYNQAMLYTENTYEIPGEPFFGFRRGRYTLQELRDLDRYAAGLGIELAGCIQTLGHLDQLLRWPEYAEVGDTAAVLMVDEPKTYALIEKMVAACAGAFRSRRVHIGMDEAFDLGRGRHLTLHGYERPFDLFNRHLSRVTAICRRHGLTPMIWSDMVFRMGSKTHAYDDPRARIPADVRRRIPKDVQLVYWDYADKPPARFLGMIRRHRALGHEPIMATAVNTCQTLWYADTTGVKPCLEACRQAKLREVLVTLWGDDGAYCEFDSALAGLAKAADLAYGTQPEPARLQARFRAVCGGDYHAVMAVAGMYHPRHAPTTLFWDDPLLRVAWVNEGLIESAVWRKLDARLAGILRQIRPQARATEPVDLAHAVALLQFLRLKIAFQQSLDAAYRRRDRAALRRTRRMIPAVVRGLDRVLASFRRQWQRRNKPFGFETIQVRLGGQRQRWLELGLRLDELAAGQAAALPELDERPRTPSVWTHLAWRYLAVSGIA